MKVKDRIYKLYTENPGFYNHIIEQIGYGDLIDFMACVLRMFPYVGRDQIIMDG